LVETLLRRYAFHGLTPDERGRIPGLARKAVTGHARACGVPCERVADLECCIGEAVKNAVRFGADGTGIVVCVSCWPGRYRWVVINDGGCWFDVAAVLLREAASTVTDDEHGRGYLLMEGLMDRLAVTRECGETRVEGALAW
jgi:anti-sigma regulatory factor (Ser/Thr protein kinase)